jgi:hypothetical protein
MTIANVLFTQFRTQKDLDDSHHSAALQQPNSQVKILFYYEYPINSWKSNLFFSQIALNNRLCASSTIRKSILEN